MGGVGTHAGMPLGVATSGEAATWATTRAESVARVVSCMAELGRVELEGGYMARALLRND